MPPLAALAPAGLSALMPTIMEGLGTAGSSLLPGLFGGATAAAGSSLLPAITAGSTAMGPALGGILGGTSSLLPAVAGGVAGAAPAVWNPLSSLKTAGQDFAKMGAASLLQDTLTPKQQPMTSTQYSDLPQTTSNNVGNLGNLGQVPNEQQILAMLLGR